MNIKKIIKESGLISESLLDRYPEDFDFVKNYRELQNICTLQAFKDKAEELSLSESKVEEVTNPDKFVRLSYGYQDKYVFYSITTSSHPYFLHKRARIHWAGVLKSISTAHSVRLFSAIRRILEAHDIRSLEDFSGISPKFFGLHDMANKAYWNSSLFKEVKKTIDEMDPFSLRLSVLTGRNYESYVNIKKNKEALSSALDAHGSVGLVDHSRAIMPEHFVNYAPFQEVFGEDFEEFRSTFKGASFIRVFKICELLHEKFPFDKSRYSVTDEDISESKRLIIELLKCNLKIIDIKHIFNFDSYNEFSGLVKQIIKSNEKSAAFKQRIIDFKVHPASDSFDPAFLDQSMNMIINSGALTKSSVIKHGTFNSSFSHKKNNYEFFSRIDGLKEEITYSIRNNNNNEMKKKVRELSDQKSKLEIKILQRNNTSHEKTIKLNEIPSLEIENPKSLKEKLMAQIQKAKRAALKSDRYWNIEFKHKDLKKKNGISNFQKYILKNISIPTSKRFYGFVHDVEKFIESNQEAKVQVGDALASIIAIRSEIDHALLNECFTPNEDKFIPLLRMVDVESNLSRFVAPILEKNVELNPCRRSSRYLNANEKKMAADFDMEMIRMNSLRNSEMMKKLFEAEMPVVKTERRKSMAV